MQRFQPVADGEGFASLDLLMESTNTDQSARRVEVVVMFTDIVDFTAYSDAHGEEASLAIVTRHENLVFPIVTGHGGTIVKTIGDAVMAYYSDVEQAALAGQAIMKAVEEGNADQPDTEQMHLRAAFNIGPVMIKNNDLFGDAVNLCSRMMGVGQPDQILISRSMIDRLGDNPKFICRYVGTADFHGKTGVVELYELLAKALELKQKTKSRIVSDTAPGTAPDAGKKEKLIGGKYFIEKLIGEGAYGKVFKARFAEDGKPVAIKILPEEAFVFYSREAQVLRQLQPFPYVMEILDALVDPQGLCIVMPYIEHGSLQSYMNKLRGEALEPGQVVSLMEELLSAIAHAHSKEVIHRDVKPQNILLRAGTDGVLTDFGVAYAVESTGRSSTMTAGTSGYIAPEVTSGRFDNTIDIYSAGVVLYKMLGGEFPMDLSTLSPSVFPDFKKIIERATAVRSKRYTQAQQMLADIQAVGGKIIAPTIQSVAQAGEERILLSVTDATWAMLEPHFSSIKVVSMRCVVTDLIKRVHWHVPAVTILDYLSLSGSMADMPAVVRACVALGTRVIVVNCPSEHEARTMIKYGAADCLPSLEIAGAIDTLKSSTETLITQVQMGSGGSWWKRILG
jgi:serine/threonine protein kinase/class 3 adenylate cyclase